MFVDKQGFKIVNGWFYELKMYNPWGEVVVGQCWWEPSKATYVFLPYYQRDIDILSDLPLNFYPLPNAPRIKQCASLMKMKYKPAAL